MKTRKKKVNNKKEINRKKNVSKKISFDVHYLLILLFVILTIFFIIILLNQYDRNKELNDKIMKFDTINNEVVVFRDNYDEIIELDKKIDEIKKENDILNDDINKISERIRYLEAEISKYKK